jgi:hypothetical protein
MSKLKYIIITTSTQEAIDLHNHMGDALFEWSLKKPQYPTEWKFYNSTWYWYIDDNGSLSGSSGHGALETAVRLCPGASIFHLTDFLKAYPKGKKYVQFNEKPSTLREIITMEKAYPVCEEKDGKVLLYLDNEYSHWIDMRYLKGAKEPQTA